MSELPKPPAPSISRRLWIRVALVVVVFTLVYAQVFAYLVQTWRVRDDYSHGFLVPFIALYFVWAKRGELSRLRPAPSFMIGIPITALAALLLVLGQVGAVVILQDMSLLVMVLGLVSLLLGKAYVRTLALSMAYLLLMIPLFGEEGDAVHWPFQLFAANIGVWVLQTLGFAAFQEAHFIHLPRITLEVAAACSGLRYLISVIAIGLPLAYTTQRTFHRRVALIGFACAVAILGNALRVALIGIWAYYRSGDVHGPLHVLQSLFVAWVGFVALFLGAWFLRETPARSSEA